MTHKKNDSANSLIPFRVNLFPRTNIDSISEKLRGMDENVADRLFVLLICVK